MVRHSKGKSSSIQNNSKPFPTSTVTQSRVNLFDATYRSNKTHLLEDGDAVVMKKRITETSWGKCEVIGMSLTQAHKCALEAMITSYEAIYQHDTGEITLLVRVSDALKIMKTKNNHSWFYGLLKDLCLTQVKIQTKKLLIEGHIVNEFYWSTIPDTKTRSSAKNVATEWNQTLLGVTLGNAYLQLYQDDLNIYYPKLVRDISSLRYGESMALVRFLITQQSIYSIKFDTLYEIICGSTTRQKKSKVKKNINSESDKLIQFGISFDGKMFHYQKPTEVFF